MSEPTRPTQDDDPEEYDPEEYFLLPGDSEPNTPTLDDIEERAFLEYEKLDRQQLGRSKSLCEPRSPTEPHVPRRASHVTRRGSSTSTDSSFSRDCFGTTREMSNSSQSKDSCRSTNLGPETPPHENPTSDLSSSQSENTGHPDTTDNDGADGSRRSGSDVPSSSVPRKRRTHANLRPRSSSAPILGRVPRSDPDLSRSPVAIASNASLDESGRESSASSRESSDQDSDMKSDASTDESSETAASSLDNESENHEQCVVQ